MSEPNIATAAREEVAHKFADKLHGFLTNCRVDESDQEMFREAFCECLIKVLTGYVPKAEADNLRAVLKDECETDRNVRDIIRPILGEALTDHDGYAVVSLEDAVETLVKRLTGEVARLRAAAQALVDRMNVVHDDPHYKSVWFSYANHHGDYSNGPKYNKELDTLKAALAQPEEQPMSDSTKETKAHICRVSELMTEVCDIWVKRTVHHDDSKLESPEKEGFDEVTGALRDLTYGSNEYKAQLAKLKPVLVHHYANNSHHPEHYENGVNGMTLIDLLEMLCDWKAAGERHADGSMSRSLEINKERFKITDQLQSILVNTAREMKWLAQPEEQQSPAATCPKCGRGVPSKLGEIWEHSRDGSRLESKIWECACGKKFQSFNQPEEQP